MAQINDILTEIKQHLLGCFAFLDCGFENVRQLLDAVKANDPAGFREYEHVLFDDRLGNYFWIEKTSDVSIARKNNGILGMCEGAYHEARQRFSLFCMVAAVKEEQLFECLAGCLANYGCKVTIAGGDYDTIAVVRKELGDVEGLNDILANLANYAVVRLDFSLIYDILPTNYDIEGCECEPCNDCGDNLPEEIIPPVCTLQITRLSLVGNALTVQYSYSGIGNVYLHFNATDLACLPATGQYTVNTNVLNFDNFTVLFSGGVSDCSTICTETEFITSFEQHVVNASATTVYNPTTVIPCTGTVVFTTLGVSNCTGTLNYQTGQVTFPAQTVAGSGNYLYYMTCNGEVIQTFRVRVTN